MAALMPVTLKDTGKIDQYQTTRKHWTVVKQFRPFHSQTFHVLTNDIPGWVQLWIIMCCSSISIQSLSSVSSLSSGNLLPFKVGQLILSKQLFLDEATGCKQIWPLPPQEILRHSGIEGWVPVIHYCERIHFSWFTLSTIKSGQFTFFVST